MTKPSAFVQYRIIEGQTRWSATYREDGGAPRADVWRGVDWVGQWAWTERGFGDRVQRSRIRVPRGILERLARAMGAACLAALLLGCSSHAYSPGLFEVDPDGGAAGAVGDVVAPPDPDSGDAVAPSTDSAGCFDPSDSCDPAACNACCDQLKGTRGQVTYTGLGYCITDSVAQCACEAFYEPATCDVQSCPTCANPSPVRCCTDSSACGCTYALGGPCE